jgi:hypothetical protein
MADARTPRLLWSDRAGNAAVALLLLVLGAILSQLKWNDLILACTITAAALIAYMALRFTYARRHPEPRPLTLEDLRAELRRAGLAPPAPAAATAQTAPASPAIEVIELPDGDEQPELRELPEEDIRELLRRSLGTALLSSYRVDHLDSLTALAEPAPEPRASAGAAFRQMLGIR